VLRPAIAGRADGETSYKIFACAMSVPAYFVDRPISSIQTYAPTQASVVCQCAR